MHRLIVMENGSSQKQNPKILTNGFLPPSFRQLTGEEIYGFGGLEGFFRRNIAVKWSIFRLYAAIF